MADELGGKSHLNQILLDNMPCVALLLRPSTREIVASNQTAVKFGAVPGTRCFATWGRRDNPCSWCLAPALWKTGQAQHLEVEALGAVWEAHWVPVEPDLYLHYAFDITDRKRKEDALRDSDETLRALLNAVPESIFLIDANRDIVAANETLAKRLGKGLKELVGSKISEILPAEVVQRRKAYADEVLRTGRAVRFEDMRDGRFFDNLIHPIMDAAGKVSKLAVFSLDITERRQAEKALRENESRLRSLYETVQAGIVLQGANGAILDANKVACDIFGVELGEITAKTSDDNFWQMVLEDGTPIPGTEHPSMITIRTGKPIRNVVRGLFANDPDRMRWLLINTEPILDPKTGILGEVTITFQDITALKQTQAALEESLSLQKATLESTADGLLVVDHNGRMVSWNQKFVDMWRIPEDICSSQDDGRALAYVLDQLQDPQGFLTKVKELYADPEIEDYDVLRFKDERVFERYSLPQYLDKQIVGRVWSFRDVTARVRAEEALRDNEQFLTDIFNSIQDGLSVIDRDLNLLRVNPAMERFGCTPPLVGKKCYEVYHGRSAPCEACPVRQTLLTGKASREIVTEHRPDGPKRYMEILAFPLQDRTSGQVRAVIEYVRDVTEPLEMERALRESEKKYHDLYNLTRLTVDNVPDLIWAKGLDNEFVLVNQATCQKLLMIDSPDEALGKPHSFFAEKERQAGFEHNFGETCDGSDDIIKGTMTPGRFLESGVIRGQKLVLDVYKTPLFNEAGELIGTVGCGRDVTREKQIEGALRESEAKYRLLVNQIPAVVFRGYADWSVDCFDDKVVALTGYSKEDFDSRRVKWCDLIPAEDFDYAQQKFLEGLKTNKSYVREHRLRRKNGEMTWVQCRGQIFCDESGKIDYVSGVSFDVSDRKHAELALQESEEKLANIIDFLPDATLVIDKEGKVIAWNKAIEEMTGIKAEDMMGRGNYEYALPFYGKRRPILIDLVLNPQEELAKYSELQQEGVSLSGVVHFPSFRGKEAYLFGKASVLLDSHGNIMGAIESIRDITDRQKAEVERLRFSKLESLGLLAGGIAHDFNNILTAIIGNISLAMLYQKMEGQVGESLAEAEKACQQAQNLARQLLTFAKGGAPVKEIISVAKIIADSMTFTCRGSKVRCDFQAADDLWLVAVDSGQIGQVFQNLIINAIQAMPTGGTIEIRAENLRLAATGGVPLSPGNYVKVSIRDQGIGIPAEYLPNIFDPYFTTKQTGSGLGLATAYSIIKNHHGDISVESTMGGGTTFHIYLPASDQEVAPQLRPDKKLHAGKGKILVMDDEAMVRNVLVKMLATLGYDVKLAQDGAEALEKFAAAQKTGDHFVAVILDLTVPGGIGGKETITKLLELDPQVKAIVSSGYSDDPIMADFKKYGFSGIIGKPYRILDLSKTLNDVIVDKK